MPRAELRALRARLGSAALLGGLAMLAGCATGSIERGVYHSAKGYRVTLPGDGWQVDREPRADLALKRRGPEGGMLVDATCDPRTVSRPLRVLVRYLVFGLTHRSVVEEEPVTVAAREGLRQVIRGERDGTAVEVEAVSVKDSRCVYDFLYVAPPPAFPAGQPAFRALVQSLSVEPR
jgi:hypothetical protein